MKIYIWAIGSIVNVFFMWMPVNGAQLPRTESKPLDPAKILPFQSQPNTIVQSILNEKWNNEPLLNNQIKRHLLELGQWYAHTINKNKDEETIFRVALQSFGKKDPVGIKKNLPILTDPFTIIPSTENPQLKEFIANINTSMRTITIENFDNNITNNNNEIDDLIRIKNTKKDYEYEHELQKLITTQLITIKTRFNFTQDTNKLAENLESLKQKARITSTANLVLLEELNKKIAEQTPEIELPITEPVPEEQPSSSTSTEEPREPEKESELPIIPYQEFSLAKLLKITRPETQASEVLPEKLISSSSSSSTSPVSSPPTSPRKQEMTPNIIAHETQKPEITPEKHASSSFSSSSSTESFQELIQQDHTPEAPFQATEGEPRVEINETKDDSNNTSSEEDEQSLPAENLPTTPPEQSLQQTKNLQDTPQTPSPTSSSFWDFLWFREKISAFFDRFFWSIYGYR